MIWVLPQWLDWLIFGAVCFGTGYVIEYFRAYPDKLKEWFD
ncbi:hypothetical protein LOSG293_110670 [Secundilactobacillus oryzae JCM 18671]|uniref:Uncharacterized protein n=1 Tax=Secundilactobacillus oryzae JCM 18671 TaxID=1291743 RepID=A0A081BI83_9LACO|nr:hypothetical protein LOSG293_110670 [Secundilactobacillus oryzae JCM 18671]